MPCLNFTLKSKIAWILDPCRHGEGQTIRPVGKRIFRPGGELYLYAHQRSKNCRKLGEAVCSEVVPIVLKCCQAGFHHLYLNVYINGSMLCMPEYTCLARADGFQGYVEHVEFENFFINTYKLTPGENLEMVIIKWRGFKPLGEKGW